MLEVSVTCDVDATQVVYLGVLAGKALLSPLAVAAYKTGGNAVRPLVNENKRSRIERYVKRDLWLVEKHTDACC